MNELALTEKIEHLAQCALLADEAVERAELRAAQLQAPVSELNELRARRAQAHAQLDEARDGESRRINLELAQRAHEEAMRDLVSQRAIVLKVREQLFDAQRRLPELENVLGIKMRVWSNTKVALALARANE